MLNAKSSQFNVNNEIAHGNVGQGSKIRRGQDAWEIGKMVTRDGTRRNLWSAFVRLWLDSRRARGESIDLDPRSRTEEEAAAGFSFCREQSLPRAAKPGSEGLRSEAVGQRFYTLPGMQHRA